jgi:hypothetical protein
LHSFAQLNIFTNDPEYQIITGSKGICAEGVDFTPEKLYLKERWKGDWIWLNKPAFGKYQGTKTEWSDNKAYKRQYKAFFRKKFELTTVPEQAILCITADFQFNASGFIQMEPGPTRVDIVISNPIDIIFCRGFKKCIDLKNGKNCLLMGNSFKF